MKYKTQTPGELTYPFLDKPVYYSPQFLATLATQTKIPIEEDHDGPKIADIQELFWQNGALWFYIDKKLDTKNKGFSTRLADWELVEEKDRYLVTKGHIKSIALTNNPKDTTTFLDNSDDNFAIVTLDNDDKKDGDNSMSEDEQIKTLNQKIGGYKTQLNAKMDEINNLKEKDTQKQEEIEDIKNKKQALEQELQEYKAKEQKKAENIAKVLAGDDEDLLNVYKEMPLDKLKILQSKQEEEQEDQNTGFTGVGDTGAGDTQNNGDINPDDEKPPYDTYEAYAQARGGW